MNVIIVRKERVSDTPILIKHNDTAEAVFKNIAKDLLGDDYEEINEMSDNMLDEVNYLLAHRNIEIEWYIDVEVNEFKN